MTAAFMAIKRTGDSIADCVAGGSGHRRWNAGRRKEKPARFSPETCAGSLRLPTSAPGKIYGWSRSCPAHESLKCCRRLRHGCVRPNSGGLGAYARLQLATLWEGGQSQTACGVLTDRVTVRQVREWNQESCITAAMPNCGIERTPPTNSLIRGAAKPQFLTFLLCRVSGRRPGRIHCPTRSA